MRTFTDLASPAAKQQLEVLADLASSIGAYQAAMTSIGRHLATEVVRKDPSILAGPVCVACTVEDADYLARGFVEGFLGAGAQPSQVKLVCFWNERVRRFHGDSVNSFDVAPIVKQYRERVDIQAAAVVVVKSIISGACVVKTNLATLIDQVLPTRVIVSAPVMLLGAHAKLASEFPAATAERFEYFTLAVDTDKTGDVVVPGIGGSVYERLGFDDHIAYVPEIVKQRRAQASAV